MYGLFYLLRCQHTDTIKYFKKHHFVCEFFYSETATFTLTKDKTMGIFSLLGPINGRNSMYLVCTHWILCFCLVGQRPERSTVAISGDTTRTAGVLVHSGIKLSSLNLKCLM